jgi:ABC-type branched-subunit amino acid transport system ATPase component
MAGRVHLRRPRPATAPGGPASAPGLEVRDVSVSYGRLRALADVSLDVPRRSVHAVIGPNGAGKSTLAGAICGEVDIGHGRVLILGRDVTGAKSWQRAPVGLGRTYQVPRVFDSLSVAENLRAAGRRAGPDAAARGLELAGLAGLADDKAGSLAAADLKRLEIGMLVAQGASVLVLDEPAAGMGAAETALLAELVEELRLSGSAVLLIEHDLDLVFRLADRVTVLNFGRAIFSGTVTEVLRDAQVREVYLRNSEAQELADDPARAPGGREAQ